MIAISGSRNSLTFARRGIREPVGDKTLNQTGHCPVLYEKENNKCWQGTKMPYLG